MALCMKILSRNNRLEEIIGERTSRNSFASVLYESQRFAIFFFRCMIAAENE